VTKFWTTQTIGGDFVGRDLKGARQSSTNEAKGLGDPVAFLWKHLNGGTGCI